MPLPEPSASRSTFPADFQLSPSPTGLLPWESVVERLTTSRNYWVAATMPDGSPHVVPTWGLWLDDGLHFGISPGSRWGKNIERHPRITVHLESADSVVIVKGHAALHRLDIRVADASKQKYGHRPEPSDTPGEGVYRLQPRVALAWNVRDLANTATRFTFHVA
jgi:hypothetical protein